MYPLRYSRPKKTFGKEIKQDDRLPLAYFAPSQFGENAILKLGNVFEKKHSFLIIFSSFSNVQFFWLFCLENLIIRVEKTSLNDTICYAF